MDFEWDEINEEHIAKHRLEPYEVEEAATDPRRVKAPSYPGTNGEPRTGITGKTLGGRIITVILTKRGDRFRVVTAREAVGSERRAYRKK